MPLSSLSPLCFSTLSFFLFSSFSLSSSSPHSLPLSIDPYCPICSLLLPHLLSFLLYSCLLFLPLLLPSLRSFPPLLPPPLHPPNPPILTRSKGWSGLCHCTTTISTGFWQMRWVLVRPFRPLPSSPTSWRRKGTMDRFSSLFLSRESRTKLKYAIDCISDLE